MDPMLEGQLKEWFVLMATFGLFGWVAYLGASIARRKQKNDMQKALLEKFSSAHDFAEFMQSPAGQKYVLSFTDAVTSPSTSILNSIKTGFVLMFLGMGCLAGANGGWITFRIGWVSFLVGVGFLISSGVAYFLTRKSAWKE
ncbi:MAG TPA: hypothetical protein VNZ47_16350 [Candidatus Dormibacteraeota bacterium]|jgi:hypothetical protein|nr:hypothetical protein [Candidatus Dormibacteraeota bacterium]